MKVFINPGHSPAGKPDPGAVNEQAELRECDLALVIGQKVRLYLERAGCETRLLQSDNLLGEGDGPCVTGAANAWGAELFVSVHCNAAQGDARGMEVLCYAMDSAGGRLASSISCRVKGRLQAIDVFCQVKIPEMSVRIPSFCTGNFPVLSGMGRADQETATFCRINACSIR